MKTSAAIFAVLAGWAGWICPALTAAEPGGAIAVAHIAVQDATGGNGDGLMNPGEEVALAVELQNVGGEALSGLTSRLRTVGQVPYVWITRSTHTWGSLAPEASADTGVLPFLLRLSPQAVTPLVFTLRLTTTDAAGRSWTSDAQFSVVTNEGGPWPMLGGNAAHTGYHPATLGGQPFAPNWTYATDFYFRANHLPIAEGKVFITRAFSGGLYDLAPVIALDLASGAVVWRRETPPGRSYSGASAHQGRLYFQRNDSAATSDFWCLDAATGATLFTVPTDGQGLHFLPPTVAGDSVFIAGGAYGGLHGFDRFTGQRRFLHDFTFSQEWTPTFGGGAVFSCVDGTLRCHDPATGTPRWSYLLDAQFSSLYQGATAAYEAGRVYLAGDTGVYAIDVCGMAPALAWKVAGFFRGIPAVAHGRVFAIEPRAERVRSFHAATGAPLGDYLTPQTSTIGQPIVTNDALLVAGEVRTFIFDLATRALLQSIEAGGFLSLSNGALITCDINGAVRSYSRTGTLNQPPAAQPASVTGIEDAPIPLTLGGTDANGDALTALVVRLPDRGTLHQTSDGVQPGAPIVAAPALVTSPQRRLIYVPGRDGFGDTYASFAFKVNDGAINSAEAVVTIGLAGVNDAPVAVADRTTARAGAVLASFDPTANNYDPDGEAVRIVSFTQPAHGAVAENADGTLRYTPAPNFAGEDVFHYTLRDGAGLTASATVTVAVGDSEGRAWPTFGGGPDHAGSYAGALGPARFEELWRVAIGDVPTPPAVAGGRVFVSDADLNAPHRRVTAFDPFSGGELWSTPLATGGTLSAPTYFDGTIFVVYGTDQATARFIGLNAADGSIRWQTPFASPAAGYDAPAVSELGAFASDGASGGLYSVDPHTGAPRFSLELEATHEWTPGLYAGAVYSCIGKMFRCHDPATGAVVWSLDVGGVETFFPTFAGTVAFAAGRAFVVVSHGIRELVCIDLSARAVAWRVAGEFTGTPAAYAGVVFALAENTVRTFAAATGQPLGDDFETDSGFFDGAPIVAADVLVAADSFASTLIFDRATRQLLQSLPVRGHTALADDVLYLAAQDRTLSAYGRIPAGNRPPAAASAVATVIEEGAVLIPLAASDPDGDALRLVIRVLPARGQLFQTPDGVSQGRAIDRVNTVAQHSGGLVLYVPAPDVFGPGADSFAFTAHDGFSASAQATVRIDITPVNDAPVAIADRIALRPGETLDAFHPEANDRDVDGDALAVIAFTQGASGHVAQNADGSLRYTPDAGFTAGTDTFAYTIRDPAGATASSTVTVIVSATFAREWPTLGNGPDHPGFQPVALGAAPLTLRWSAALGRSRAQLAVAGGRVFVSDHTNDHAHVVVALEAASGGEMWRRNFSGGSGLSAPSVFGDDVFTRFAASTSSPLSALRVADGSTRWSAPINGLFGRGLAPAIDAARAYVSGENGLHGFDRATGARLFSQALPAGYADSGPALHGGGLFTFVAGSFRSHDPSTGSVLWSLEFGGLGNTFDSTVACADARAFFIHETFNDPALVQDIIAVDLTARAVLWKVRGRFNGTPAVAHGAVFALAEGSVRAFDAATGRDLGTYAAPGASALVQQPIVTHDTLVASSSTRTWLFDLRTRALRQTLDFGSAMAAAGTTLYLVSSGGTVRAFGGPDAFDLPPTAQPLALVTAEDVPVAIELAGSDPENAPLNFAITRLPAEGVLFRTEDGVTPGAAIAAAPALVTGAPARVLYVPPPDRHGAALGDFAYVASDGSSASAEAAATVDVAPVNDAPLAVADARQTLPGQSLSPLRETANDVDPDGDALTVVAFTQPPAGRVAQNADGTLRYDPPPGATTGTETFTYTLEDAAGARATAGVSVSIVPALQGFWPTFGNGADHTGYTAAALGRGPLTLRWSYAARLPAHQVPIGGGKVFFSSGNEDNPAQRITALDEKTGAQLWQRTFSTGGYEPQAFAIGSHLFLRRGGATGRELLALSTFDGQTVWSRPQPAISSPGFLAPVSDGTVFTARGQSGGVDAFEQTTGAPVFVSAPLSDPAEWAPALHDGALYTFVDGKFRGHDATTGAVRWTLDLGRESAPWLPRTVALAGRNAWVIRQRAYPDARDLICLHLEARAVQWLIRGQFSGTAAVQGGVVYALTGSTVQARSALDGRLLGIFAAPAGEGLFGQPLVTAGLVLAASGTKTFVWDRDTRALVQTIDRGGALSAGDDQLLIAGGLTSVSAYAAPPALTFSPPGGIYDDQVSVALTPAAAGARIYYTLDGSAPNLTSPSVLAGQPVLLTFIARVRAMAVLGSEFSRIYEQTYAVYPLDDPAALRDSDGDGARDLAEAAAGTDPHDPRDVFSICHCARSDAGLELAWPSKTNRHYVLETSPDCTAWTAATGPMAGTGEVLRVVCPTEGMERCFFRVRVAP